jgi:hypothetical protein
VSYSCDFNIHIGPRTRSHVDFIRALLQRGWSPEHTNDVGIVLYVIPSDTIFGTYLNAPLKDLEEVFRNIAKYDGLAKTYGIFLSWPREKNLQINVNFYPYEYPDDDVIQINITRGRVILSSGPPFTDHNWYLERILPACLQCGFLIQGLEWSEGC